MKQLIFTLLLLTSFALIGCGSANEPDSILPKSVSMEDQPVEYDASLGERDEAVAVDGAVKAKATALPTLSSPLADSNAQSSEMSVPVSAADEGYREIEWDDLVPEDFSADAIMDKYSDQIAALQDGSPEAYELYTQMQEELNNAPVNVAVDETLVKLPGFIAPLEYNETLITEFLLVPYFGACIHSPAPPANQTVLVKMAEGQGIKTEESYWPIWIKGEITTESATTDLAESGYYMENAQMEPYEQ